ncbi:hypothetical protein J1N35_031181 [Gossypium stocksii]|uniref:Molybdopterin oxidoreductase domain-containing protein n=1 Tax=Gossypium stocksii TaxID=47602 RepID=A0A9D3V246_9ROSI|nr:hypothetical protein J1N35_031181 [Gossypium stocksii]
MREDKDAIFYAVETITKNGNVIRPAWNGFNVLLLSAAQAAALDLGLVPESSNSIESAKFLYLMGADDVWTKFQQISKGEGRSTTKREPKLKQGFGEGILSQPRTSLESTDRERFEAFEVASVARRQRTGATRSKSSCTSRQGLSTTTLHQLQGPCQSSRKKGGGDFRLKRRG